MVEPISDAGLRFVEESLPDDLAPSHVPEWSDWTVARLIARLRSLEAERDALKAALEPFAKEGRIFTGTGMFAHINDFDGCSMPVGDLRRAHRALNPAPSDV